MDARHAIAYRELGTRHWWSRARNRAVLDLVRQALPGPNSEQRILDIGCGNGAVLELLSPFGHVEGLEPDADILLAETESRWLIHRCAFDEDFLPGQNYHLITLLDVLEHLEDDQAALEQIARILAPGGKLILTVPAHQQLWTSHDDLNHHCRRYTRKPLLELLCGAGLTPIRSRYFFHGLAAAKFAVRSKEALYPTDPRPPAIPPAIINRALEWVCRLEFRLTAPVALPFGSSLLVLAHKT